MKIQPTGVLVGLLLARHRYKASDARKEALMREAAIVHVLVWSTFFTSLCSQNTADDSRDGPRNQS
jgi:hypothetical protein